MVRAILGAVVGVFVAVLTIAMLEALSHWLFPPPEGFQGPLTPEDLEDRDALEALMRATPLPAKIAVVAGWAIGAFAGAGTALRLSGGKAWPAALPPAIVFAGAVLTIATLPHPFWMSASAIITIPAAGLLALRAFGPRRPPAAGAL